MDNRQKKRREYRAMPHGYYHLCTDGWSNGKLFRTQEEYAMGMTAIALAVVKFGIKVYAFVLMPNHIHLLLSASGSVCVDIFDFLVRRINKQLVADGFPTLPETYDFKLVPIPDKKSFVSHFIYIVRNTYEKGICIPGGYPWGSDALYFSQWGELIRGTRIDALSKREKIRRLKSEIELPGHWEFNAELGVLPRSFVSTQKVRELIPSVKAYLTRLIKDYESMIHVSRVLEETITFAKDEIDDIASQTAKYLYPDCPMKELSVEDKCKLAVQICKEYGFLPKDIAGALRLPERVVAQALRSKDYGIR